MERSWLQEQVALSRFDGFRESERLSCVKPTAAPAPSLASATSRAPVEAGLSADVVYDPQDSSADWSGFAPRHCAGRQMHPGTPAAHRETIARSEEHGIVPAAHAITEDSVRTRRRRCAEPVRVGEGLLIGGPSAPGPKERFTTCARAANRRVSTPLELLKSESCRNQKAIGKRHVTPAFEQHAATHKLPVERRLDRAGFGPSGPPFGDPLPNSSASLERAPPPPIPLQGGFGSRATSRASRGPESFLDGLGRQMAGSEASWRRQEGSEAEGDRSREKEGVRAKELYSANYSPYVTGYTGHQPRR